jgi:hypothetical protein
VVDLEAAVSDDAQTATMLAPLRDALVRVERQVGTLERDRVEQFSQVSVHLADVTTSTNALRSQTASLVGSLNASTVPVDRLHVNVRTWRLFPTHPGEPDLRVLPSVAWPSLLFSSLCSRC